MIILADMNSFMHHPLQYPWLLAPGVFILGAILGSLLNVCIYRLPLEKSIFWPSSRCMKCLHPLRWSDNIPLLSYYLLKGQCRYCKEDYSSRYFWIELFTGATFAGLFIYYLGLNDQVIDAQGAPNLFREVSDFSLLVMSVLYFLFCCLLIVVTFTDIDHREIPLTVTIPGTIMGLLFSTLAPYPWPLNWLPSVGSLFGGQFASIEQITLLPTGFQLWPFWMPTNELFPLHSWQLGLLTSVLGALVGTGMVRAIRWLFSWGFGKEAMGIGDADLMMMIGAFLGWQATVIIFILGVFIAMAYALCIFVLNRGRELPFGPFLTIATALLLWSPVPLLTVTQRIFFDGLFLLMMGSVGTILALLMAFAIRITRLIRMAT